MQCEQARGLIHDWLDGEIEPLLQKELKMHIANCDDCAKKYELLRKTESLLHVHVQSNSFQVDTDDQQTIVFREKLRAYRLKRSLPPPKRSLVFRQWLRLRGGAILIALSVGVLVGAGIMHIWHEIYNTDVLVVQSEALHDLKIEKKRVLIEAEKVIAGDVLVRHGDVVVYGTIKGNLTVIDGRAEIAQGAKIEGAVRTVNGIVDWIH